jgi:hypothetical protein
MTAWEVFMGTRQDLAAATAGQKTLGMERPQRPEHVKQVQALELSSGKAPQRLF